jgi:hypothetical protein
VAIPERPSCYRVSTVGLVRIFDCRRMKAGFAAKIGMLVDGGGVGGMSWLLEAEHRIKVTGRRTSREQDAHVRQKFKHTQKVPGALRALRTWQLAGPPFDGSERPICDDSVTTTGLCLEK